MDRGGHMAATGTVDAPLLASLLSHRFLRQRPPKSTGREEFGEPFLARLLATKRRRRLAANDLMATCSLFTAMAVGMARRWLKGLVDDVIVGGGGVRNRTLKAHLTEVFAPTPVRTFEDLGCESQSFEAVAFAVLAYQTVHGECANVPAATGAKHAVILGTIVPGTRRWQGDLR